MNHVLVLDASVVIKRVLDEEFTEQVQGLFADSIRSRRPLVAPPLLPNEITNALYQRVRTTVSARRITESEGSRALAAFLRLPVTLLSPADLYRHAFAFALAHGLSSTYDAVYVVLAQQLESELWTADQRLYNAVRAAAPFVRWIGDFASV